MREVRNETEIASGFFHPYAAKTGHVVINGRVGLRCTSRVVNAVKSRRHRIAGVVGNQLRREFLWYNLALVFLKVERSVLLHHR